MLAELLEWGYVRYVAMDVKGPFSRYHEITRVRGSAEAVATAMEAMQDSNDLVVGTVVLEDIGFVLPERGALDGALRLTERTAAVRFQALGAALQLGGDCLIDGRPVAGRALVRPGQLLALGRHQALVVQACVRHERPWLRLGDFGFANMVFSVPPNSASYSTRLDVRDSLGVYVDVTAGINVGNHTAFWIFQTIAHSMSAALLPPTRRPTPAPISVSPGNRSRML